MVPLVEIQMPDDPYDTSNQNYDEEDEGWDDDSDEFRSYNN